MIVARRESRIVLPKTLPEAVDAGTRADGVEARAAADRPLDFGGHVRRASPVGRGRTAARNVSSSDGSRLTKSTSSYVPRPRTTGVIGPETRIRRTWSSVDDVADAGQRRELARRARRRRRRSSTWWWARSRRASTRSTLTSRPSRMIATRSQVCSTSDEDVARQEDRPALGLGLADDLVERLLDERVETRRRLVEDAAGPAGAGARRPGRPSACCPSSTP